MQKKNTINKHISILMDCLEKIWKSGKRQRGFARDDKAKVKRIILRKLKYVEFV